VLRRGPTAQKWRLTYYELCVLGVLELAMRLPDNKRLQRRFRADAAVSTVAVFLTSSGLDMHQHVIIRSFPRKVLPDVLALHVFRLF